MTKINHIKVIIAAFILRSVLLAIAVLVLEDLFELGTNPLLVISSGILGIALATGLSFSRLKSRGFILGLFLLLVIFKITFNLIYNWFPVSQTNTFWPYLIEEHLTTALISFLVGAILTWSFWRTHHAATLEAISVCLIVVWLLSAHRNYHLDSPQAVNSFAWSFGIAPQIMFVAFAVSACSFILLYLAAIQNTHRSSGLVIRSGRFSRIGSLLGACFIFIVIASFAKQILSSYQIDKGMLSNGVGEKSEEGQSPLGFHSALGSTSQPAALVRLEGDYTHNPFSPMLYLRESALSEFNGNEMVIAASQFDTDISRTGPTEPFIGTEDSSLTNRMNIQQSVYLLADQRNAFAIDYPIELKPLVNPDPTRFRAAYKAISLAPTFSLEEVRYDKIGDPRWSAEVLAHYLKEHPNHKYRDLALSLTKDFAAPIEKAAALATYLSKNSVYTLTPNHKVDPSEDQTAPYLFGDLRGYCVHFAHATVYMLRALGIPSRIGTGYLTDLKESKDGHILLRMSDRHAWAEVYIAQRGWVPFDTQPEQVENAADAQVDMKLLEELMQKLEPDKEILPDETIKNENNIFEPEKFKLPDPMVLLYISAGLILIYILLKLYLRFFWFVAFNPRSRLYRSYIAVASLLEDLGYARDFGQTRSEYGLKIASQFNAPALSLFEQTKQLQYRKDFNLSKDEIDLARKAVLSRLSSVPRWRRMVAFVNPAAVLSLLGGQRW